MMSSSILTRGFQDVVKPTEKPTSDDATALTVFESSSSTLESFDYSSSSITPKPKAKKRVSEATMRQNMIDAELNGMIDEMMKLDEFCEEEEMEKESYEALMRAAKEICYTCKYYDVSSDKVIYFPSVTKVIVNADLFEKAEAYYLEEGDEFPADYFMALRGVALDQIVAKGDADKDEIGDDLMARLSLAVQLRETEEEDSEEVKASEGTMRPAYEYEKVEDSSVRPLHQTDEKREAASSTLQDPNGKNLEELPKSEAAVRQTRIETELNDMIAEMMKSEEFEDENAMEKESYEALMKAAKEICYTRKYYDVLSDKLIYFPSIVKTIVNMDLFEKAETYYFEGVHEFPDDYSMGLRTIAFDRMVAEADADGDKGEEMEDDLMERLSMAVQLKDTDLDELQAAFAAAEAEDQEEEAFREGEKANDSSALRLRTIEEDEALSVSVRICNLQDQEEKTAQESESDEETSSMHSPKCPSDIDKHQQSLVATAREDQEETEAPKTQKVEEAPSLPKTPNSPYTTDLVKLRKSLAAADDLMHRLSKAMQLTDTGLDELREAFAEAEEEDQEEVLERGDHLHAWTSITIASPTPSTESSKLKAGSSSKSSSKSKRSKSTKDKLNQKSEENSLSSSSKTKNLNALQESMPHVEGRWDNLKVPDLKNAVLASPKQSSRQTGESTDYRWWRVEEEASDKDIEYGLNDLDFAPQLESKSKSMKKSKSMGNIFSSPKDKQKSKSYSSESVREGRSLDIMLSPSKSPKHRSKSSSKRDKSLPLKHIVIPISEGDSDLDLEVPKPKHRSKSMKKSQSVGDLLSSPKESRNSKSSKSKSVREGRSLDIMMSPVKSPKRRSKSSSKRSGPIRESRSLRGLDLDLEMAEQKLRSKSMKKSQSVGNLLSSPKAGRKSQSSKSKSMREGRSLDIMMSPSKSPEHRSKSSSKRSGSMRESRSLRGLDLDLDMAEPKLRSKSMKKSQSVGNFLLSPKANRKSESVSKSDERKLDIVRMLEENNLWDLAGSVLDRALEQTPKSESKSTKKSKSKGVVQSSAQQKCTSKSSPSKSKREGRSLDIMMTPSKSAERRSRSLSKRRASTSSDVIMFPNLEEVSDSDMQVPESKRTSRSSKKSWSVTNLLSSPKEQRKSKSFPTKSTREGRSVDIMMSPKKSPKRKSKSLSKISALDLDLVLEVPTPTSTSRLMKKSTSKGNLQSSPESSKRKSKSSRVSKHEESTQKSKPSSSEESPKRKSKSLKSSQSKEGKKKQSERSRKEEAPKLDPEELVKREQRCDENYRKHSMGLRMACSANLLHVDAEYDWGMSLGHEPYSKKQFEKLTVASCIRKKKSSSKTVHWPISQHAQCQIVNVAGYDESMVSDCFYNISDIESFRIETIFKKLNNEFQVVSDDDDSVDEEISDDEGEFEMKKSVKKERNTTRKSLNVDPHKRR